MLHVDRNFWWVLALMGQLLTAPMCSAWSPFMSKSLSRPWLQSQGLTPCTVSCAVSWLGCLTLDRVHVSLRKRCIRQLSQREMNDPEPDGRQLSEHGQLESATHVGLRNITPLSFYLREKWRPRILKNFPKLCPLMNQSFHLFNSDTLSISQVSGRVMGTGSIKNNII